MKKKKKFSLLILDYEEKHNLNTFLIPNICWEKMKKRREKNKKWLFPTPPPSIFGP